MALPVDIVKIIVLGALFLMTFLFGILPLLLLRLLGMESHGSHQQPHSPHRRRLASYARFLSYLSCLAAGVFLATCFLDLLPGVRQSLIKSLYANQIYTGFPVAEFVMVVGLFTILIIEQIVLTARESTSPNQNYDNVRQPLLQPPVNDQRDLTESHDSANSLGGLSDEPQRGTGSSRDENLSQSLYEQQAGPLRGNNFVRSPSADSPRSAGHPVHSSHSPLRAMLLLLALALHSIFEGLTIGLQVNTEDVLSIFAALSLHKCILSFSLGMNLIQSRISRKSVVKSVLAFSVSSPIGIAIGIAVDQLWTSVSSGLFHGLLQGLASGTFLYIIFFEILPKEFNNASERLLKVLFLIIGYGIVTGILFIGDDTKHPFCITEKTQDR